MYADNKLKDQLNLKELRGLSNIEVDQQRALNGTNHLSRGQNLLIQNLISVIKEPMFILLLVACGVYFSIREYSEAFSMLAALFLLPVLMFSKTLEVKKR